jgi:hypothetical protein
VYTTKSYHPFFLSFNKNNHWLFYQMNPFLGNIGKWIKIVQYICIRKICERKDVNNNPTDIIFLLPLYPMFDT